MEKHYVEVGRAYMLTLPWSEVCMHMKVADKSMTAEILPTGVQLLNPDGSRFSAPITHGEAGLYRDETGLYFLA